MLLAPPVPLPADSPGWERDATPLLTNFNNMYQPCVVQVGGEWRYRMWFFGWSAKHANQDMGWGCDAIFYARSRNLKTWEVWCGEELWDDTMNPERWRPVLHASERWYDNWHNGDPSVVVEGDRFYMAYSATSKPFATTAGYPSDMVQCIIGATSTDGIHWEKTRRPLLVRKEDSAAPSPEPDRIGDFHRPCLRREAGGWKLWFDYWVPGKGACLVMGKDQLRILAHPKKGETSELLKLPATLATGEWHRVKIEFKGPTLTAIVNDKLIAADNPCVAEEKLTFGLDPQQRYEIENFDGGKEVRNGSDLMKGHDIRLQARPAAAVLRLKAVQ